MEVVVAIVDDEERVAPGPAVARGHVERDAAAAEYLAVEPDLVEGAGPRLGIGLDALGGGVAGSVGDRVGAKRIAGAVGVERVLDPFAAPSAHDLELVLDARTGRDLEGEVPQVGAGELLQMLRR